MIRKKVLVKRAFSQSTLTTLFTCIEHELLTLNFCRVGLVMYQSQTF